MRYFFFGLLVTFRNLMQKRKKEKKMIGQNEPQFDIYDCKDIQSVVEGQADQPNPSKGLVSETSLSTTFTKVLTLPKRHLSVLDWELKQGQSAKMVTVEQLSELQKPVADVMEAMSVSNAVL